MTIYDLLRNTPASPDSYNPLEDKVLNSVSKKLRSRLKTDISRIWDDIKSEVRLEWWRREYQPPTDGTEADNINQAAAYAEQIAIHTGLRVWRRIGNPVYLSESAFKKRKDGTTPVQPIHLSDPIEWGDVDDILQPQNDGGRDHGYGQT